MPDKTSKSARPKDVSSATRQAPVSALHSPVTGNIAQMLSTSSNVRAVDVLGLQRAAGNKAVQRLRETMAIQRESEGEGQNTEGSISADDSFAPGGDFENRLAATSGGGSPLGGSTREFMEQRFDADFGDVRLHSGSEAVQLSREIGAQAFTRGEDIYLGEGKENVESGAGKQLLAHELTHVVQQSGGALRRKSVQAGLIQRSAKPNGDKTLKKLTQALEKVVRKGGDASAASNAIFVQDADYYLKLFRYKVEKHQGKNEDKFKAYKKGFPMDALKEAWKQHAQYTIIFETMYSFFSFLAADADTMSVADPAFFLAHVLTPYKKDTAEASNFLRILERPVLRNAIRTLNGGNDWKAFVADIPQFAVSQDVYETVQNEGLHLTAEQIVDRIFDAVVSNRKIDVGYYTNNLTEDPGPVNILKNATPEEKAARLERARLDATKPAQPSLQCDNLMKVLQKVVEMYPGLATTFAIGMEKQALLTVPLNTLGGGLIPNTFGGNVVDAAGEYSNQIFFTGVVGSAEPNSHTWNIIGGKAYDSVLGTKGAGVAGSIQGSFKQKKVGEAYQAVWEDGTGRTLTKITTKVAAANHMGFSTAYQRNW